MIPLQGAALPTTGARSYLYQRTADHKHRGIDLPARKGTPVYAAGAGQVEHANRDWRPGFTGYGRNITLRHDGGVRSLYAHLERVQVDVGDPVRSGQRIGTVGKTRFSKADHEDELNSGPHLHFEVAPRRYPMPKEGRRLDPVAWLQSSGAAQQPQGQPAGPRDQEPRGRQEPRGIPWVALALLGGFLWLRR